MAPCHRSTLLTGTLAALALASVAIAQVASPPATTPAAPVAPAAAPATQPATQPSAEDVLRDLMQQRRDNPIIDPVRRPSVGPATTAAPQLDPAIVGVAPGAEPPKLRREGEFVISRRGRILRSGNQSVFVFEADSEKSPEPPMILVPCMKLQEIEDLIQERGDKVVFILSGQVFVYRGANYIVPTMSRLAQDQGNLIH